MQQSVQMYNNCYINIVQDPATYKKYYPLLFVRIVRLSVFADTYPVYKL